MIAGSGPSPASSASRSLCRPPQTTIRSNTNSVEPPALRAVTTTSVLDGRRPKTSWPSSIFAPSATASAASACVTSAKSTIEVDGECSAPTPRTWGSSSRSSSGPMIERRGRRWPCPLLDVVQPRAFDLVEGDQDLAAGDPADAASFAELFEQADTAAAQQPPCWSRARSRGPRARRRCCVRSGVRRGGPLSRTASRPHRAGA